MLSIRKGFTLVEILIVLSLIGLFVAATSYLTHDSRIAQKNAARLADNINTTFRTARTNMVLGKGVSSGSTLTTADKRVISVGATGITTIYGTTNTGTESNLPYPFYDNDPNYKITDISVSSGILRNGLMPNWDQTGVTQADITILKDGTIDITSASVSTKINAIRITAGYEGFEQSVMLDRIMGRSEVVEGKGLQTFVTIPASVTPWTACNNGTQTCTCTEQSGGDAITCASLGFSGGINNRSCGTPAVCNNAVKYACTSGTSVSNVANSCSQNSTWGCNSTDGGVHTPSNACFFANPICINGSCNVTFNAYPTPAPTCLTGTPTAISGTGPWTWGCNSPNGGTNTAAAACSANKKIDCIGAWGACSGGNQTYSVSTPVANGGVACIANNGATQSCGTPASVTGWSACSGGNQTRTCTEAIGGGAPTCAGLGAVVGVNNQSCGTPASVTGWSACSGGNQTRTCTEATGGGAPTCAGLGVSVGVNNQSCGVNGGWSGWGACSVGNQTRTCTNPAPSGGGAACIGSSIQSCGTPGVCNNTGAGYLCTVGTVTSDNALVACNTTRTWTCLSPDGGVSTSCSLANPACPITGVCSGTPGSCTYGVATDNGQTSCNTNRQWTCNGANGGGASPTCSSFNGNCPITGVCSGSPGSCTYGLAWDNGQTSCNTNRQWTCNGAFGGGASPTCSSFNGACCVPNGSCSAASPVCTNLTTYGTDNCGNSCSYSMSTCMCSPGSDGVTSLGGTNTCSASWGWGSIGQTLSVGVTSTPGPAGSLIGTCILDGPASTATSARWNYSFTCPDAAIPTCGGGGWGVNSPNGSNYCAFSVGITAVGSSVNLVGSGNPTGSATATCNPGPSWSYTYNCPNTAGATCAGGATWYNSCYFTWAPQTQGFSSSASASPGNGFVSATCNSSGGWDITSLWCL